MKMTALEAYVEHRSLLISLSKLWRRERIFFFPPAFFTFFHKGAFPPDPLSFSPRDISKFRVCHETFPSVKGMLPQITGIG